MKKLLLIIPILSLFLTSCDKETARKATEQTQKALDELNERGQKLLNQNGENNDHEPKGTLESDQVINRRVVEELSNDSSLSKELSTIQVSTQEGKVTLKGSVSSSEKMDQIVQKVKRVKGVKSVNNQLAVASNRDSSSERSDNYNSPKS